MRNLVKLFGGVIVALSALLSSNANATIYVPDYGTTGSQSFEYTFDGEFDGYVLIGMSNVYDGGLTPILDLVDFSGLLAGEANATLSSGNQGTSAFLNTLGLLGTSGDFLMFSFDAFAGDSFGFGWTFTATDYLPFSDFAFVAMFSYATPEPSMVYYNVLAEIGDTPVPAPAPLALLGLGALLLGLRRKLA